MDQRGFKVRVYEGTYSGEFTIWVDVESIEMFGNDEIERQAKREWRRRFGDSIGMAAYGVKILGEVEE